MSRRIATDQGGRRGPQSSQISRQPEGHVDRRRDDDRRMDRNERATSTSNPNAPMSLNPFSMNFGPNGMPMFPPGFQFQFGQQNNQE